MRARPALREPAYTRTSPTRTDDHRTSKAGSSAKLGGGIKHIRFPLSRTVGNVMNASLLVTAAALAIAASAVPSTARDKFGPWGPPVNLGATVNSACANLTCESERPAISRDNLSLYFDSNRLGSAHHHIWVSHRASVDDPWETPQSLGPPVNTGAEEFSPALSPNGHWLFFGSNRPGGCGGSTSGLRTAKTEMTTSPGRRPSISAAH
jgi:hypothetical protein